MLRTFKGPVCICACIAPLFSHGPPKRPDPFAETRVPVVDIGGNAIRGQVAFAPTELLGEAFIISGRLKKAIAMLLCIC